MISRACLVELSGPYNWKLLSEFNMIEIVELVSSVVIQLSAHSLSGLPSA